MNKGSQTRQAIIQQSLQLFTVKGYFNTSINDILDATHLTKGGLYGHFRSKEDIWYAVYNEAVTIWRTIVFKDIRTISDPIKRIEKVIENDLKNYLGADIFDGGCFFLNGLVELSGQSTSMSKKIVKGFVQFSKLFQSWLEEAKQKNMVKKDLNFKEISNFILISVNGAAALYLSTRDPQIWKQSITQLKFYLNQLKK